MKKYLILALILVGLTFALAAEDLESDLYYKSYPISVVYPAEEGYRIVYMKSDMTYHVFYVPMEWFVAGPDSQGELLYGNGPTYPYFTVYWKEGAFSHIKLYLSKDKRHPSWGDLPRDRDYSDKFNVTEPLLEF